MNKIKKIKLISSFSIILMPYVLNPVVTYSAEINSFRGNGQEAVLNEKSDQKQLNKGEIPSTDVTQTINEGSGEEYDANKANNIESHRQDEKDLNQNTITSESTSISKNEREGSVIKDPLLKKATIYDKEKNEFSSISANSILNGTAINMELVFSYTSTYQNGDKYNVIIPEFISLKDIDNGVSIKS